MQHHHSLNRLALAAALAVGAASAGAQTVLAQHQGASNPLDQGWAIFASTGGAGVPVNDAGTPAWQVVDTSTFAGLLQYADHIDPVALAPGWTLDVRARVADLHSTANSSAFFGVVYQGISFSVFFGSRDGSTLELRPYDIGSDISLPGLAAGYVDYRLSYDPVTASATLSVNGTVVSSGFAGFAVPSNGTYAQFGVGASPWTGGANFNKVAVTAVPEPGTWALWLGGIAALAALRRRRPA